MARGLSPSICSKCTGPILSPSAVRAAAKAVSSPTTPMALCRRPRAFFLRRVGGVVGGDAVDGAVAHPGDEGLAILFRAQGGIHFIFSVVAVDILFAQRRWWGVTSQVTGSPLALALRTSSTLRAVEMWQTW